MKSNSLGIKLKKTEDELRQQEKEKADHQRVSIRVECIDAMSFISFRWPCFSLPVYACVHKYVCMYVDVYDLLIYGWVYGIHIYLHMCVHSYYVFQ